jgi:ATP-dependent RNA helicase SUPV3L1/SUV3
MPAKPDIVDSHSLLPEIYFGPSPSGAPVADAPSVVAEAAPVAEEAALAAEAVTSIVDTAPAAGVADTTVQAVPASAEPEMIEVWRPGRFEARERPRHARGPRHHVRRGNTQHSAPAQADANGVTQTADAPPAETRPQGDKRPHRGHRPHRGDRPEGQRPPQHGKRGRHDDRRERHERPERRERQERQPDPNSPFAKLAALKAQLESGGKERS